MVEMTCEEHDRHAASTQFITHTVSVQSCRGVQRAARPSCQDRVGRVCVQATYVHKGFRSLQTRRDWSLGLFARI